MVYHEAGRSPGDEGDRMVVEGNRKAFMQGSQKLFGDFFGELRKRGLIRPIINAYTNRPEKVEYYDFNQYGAYNGETKGDFEFRIVKDGSRYYLNVKTIVEVGKRWSTGREENHTQEETFESEPKKLAHIEIDCPIRGARTSLGRTEVTDSLFFKKGTDEQAKAIHDGLAETIAMASTRLGINTRQ